MKGLAKNAVKTGANIATLKYKLIIAGIAILLFVVFVFAVGVIQSIISGSSGDSTQEGEYVKLPSGSLQLNEKVESYRGDVEIAAEKYGVETHVDVLLAMMMQESGGKGNDPFQASESKCGVIGCIQNPQESIDQGVKYYSQVLESANGNVKLTLQSYNFGGGFIDYVLNNGDGYSKDIAIEFSSMKYEELKHTGNYSCIHPEYVDEGACYGDVNYVDNVLRYYQPESAEVIQGITPSGEWANPVQEGLEINSPYGNRTDPINGGEDMHNGVDFACVGGITSINSVDQGKVVHAENLSGWGNSVVVQHDNNLYSHYAHLSAIIISKGDTVNQGEQVGICGSTGNSTGPHLHLEARKGMWDGHFDPMEMFQ